MKANRRKHALLRETGAYADGLDAIYNEDWHHAAFVALTGRRQAYFTDYQGSTREFAAMAEHGPLYQGQWYSWQKQPRGGFALGLPPYRFVNFLENHDQAANTSVGSRLYQRVDAARWRALTALLLLGPAVPMLFQGQEFASSHPFFYFADHECGVGQGGRRRSPRIPCTVSADDDARDAAGGTRPGSSADVRTLQARRYGKNR